MDDRHPPVGTLRLPRILAALADPVRLAMVRALATTGEIPCTMLYTGALRTEAGPAVGRSTFSHHQRVLREAGILHERVHGAQRLITIRRGCLEAAFPGLLDAILAVPADRV
jgi:DNA-binding transcriptional ArsR family regulator